MIQHATLHHRHEAAAGHRPAGPEANTVTVHE